MTDLRKAAEMALKTLENVVKSHKYEGGDPIKALQVLRQALAQPEQEQPKHWSDCAVYNEPAYPKGECDCGGFDSNNKWHGLTEKEAESLAFDVIADGVSKILAQPEQEPVAWMSDHDVDFKKSSFGTYPCVPLYTAPPSLESAVLAEREVCLKEIAIGLDDRNCGPDAHIALNNVYAAIRARSEK